jgi:ubiquinone/menaquinone biosynthesis C-methylase UbiE
MTNSQSAYRGRTKYDQKTAVAYQERKPGKHRAEMSLMDRALVHIPKSHRVLDVPCGGGRVSVHLAQQGYKVSAGDLSDAMIEIARQNFAHHNITGTVDKQDVERLGYPDRAFDTIISFRLFHHFPTPEIRQRVVTELCRVASRYVVLSYFSPLSFTSVKRKIRAATGGRKSDKHPTPLSEVEQYFKNAGFRLAYAQMPVIHTLHLAVFERQETAAS